MRVLAFLFIVLLGVLCDFAFAGTVTIAGWGDMVVDSNDCETVRVGVNKHHMSIGSAYRIISCSASPVVVGSTLMYSNGGGIGWTSGVTAVTAPAQTLTLSSLAASVAALEAATGTGGSADPFDYVKAAALFSFFFSFVVGVWIVGKNIGLILNAVRHW